MTPFFKIFIFWLPQTFLLLHICSCGQCPPLPADYDYNLPYVFGPLKFIVDDPGRQSIGSFHPITDGEWTEGTYISTAREQLCLAVVKNDVNQVKEMLKNKADPSGKDGLGRTPLHLGCMSGSVEASLLLIEAGAKLTFRMADGRTPLHTACEYGHPAIVKAILKRTAENRKRMERETDPANASSKKGNTSVTKKKGGENSEDEEDYDEDDYEDDDEYDYDDEESEGDTQVAAQADQDDPNSIEMKFDVIDVEKTDWDMV